MKRENGECGGRGFSYSVSVLPVGSCEIDLNTFTASTRRMNTGWAKPGTLLPCAHHLHWTAAEFLPYRPHVELLSVRGTFPNSFCDHWDLWNVSALLHNYFFTTWPCLTSFFGCLSWPPPPKLFRKIFCLFSFLQQFPLLESVVLSDQGSSHLPHHAHCQLYINPKFIHPDDDNGIVCPNHEKFSFLCTT